MSEDRCQNAGLNDLLRKTNLRTQLMRQVSDICSLISVLWLFDIVDRMQSTLGRAFTRTWWRELLCVAMSAGCEQCTSK